MRSGLLALHLFFLFLLCLALDAQGGHGSCLEPRFRDFFSTGLTKAVSARIDSFQGLFDFSDQFSLLSRMRRVKFRSDSRVALSAGSGRFPLCVVMSFTVLLLRREDPPWSCRVDS